MKSAIKSFGGKGMMLGNILERLPAGKLYLEAYGGAGSVLLAKSQHAEVEIYNDLNQNVYSVMLVLSSSELFEAFQHRCELALYDETTSDDYRIQLREGNLHPADRAYMFWYLNRTRFNSVGGFSVSAAIRRHMSKSVSDMLASVEWLPELHNRLSRVVVCNQDALRLLDKFDRPGSIYYLDPPYVQSTRTKERYPVDADDDHHQALIDALLNIKHAKVMLSGYDNALYDRLDWHKHSFTINTVDGNAEPKQKLETLWMNYILQRRMF